ncbi:MAG: MFS transporter [Desulfobacterales bacterium]
MDKADMTPADESTGGSTPPSRKRKIPLRTKLAFSSGAFQEAMLGAAAMTTMLFYNQILGLSPTLCGVAFLVASIVDGISDPLVGGLSDRFDSKWGRRHPFMLVSAFPLGISYYFLYQPMDGLSGTGLLAWFITSMVIMRLAQTFYNIPHDALGAEFTDDYHERTSVFGYNTVIGTGATVVMGMFVFWVLFPSTPEYSNGLLDPGRYPTLAMIGVPIIIGAILICTFGTRDQIPYLHRINRTPMNVRRYFGDLLELLRNPSYISVCVSWLTIAAGTGIFYTVTTYTYIYAYELSTEQLVIAGFVKLPGIFTALPLAAFMTRWLDKKKTVIMIALVAGIATAWPHALRMIGWFPDNDYPYLLWMLFTPLFISSLIMPVMAIVVDSQLVDITDDHEYRTGNRAEGLVFSIRTFAIKATAGLGGLIGGFGLEFIDFPENAEVGQVAPDVLDGLLFMSGPLYFIILFIGVLFMGLYRLNEKRHQEILTTLEERRAAGD